MTLRAFSLIPTLALALVAAPLAHAVTISGTVWSNQSADVPTSTAGIAAANKSATFTATSLDFCVSALICTPPSSGVYNIGGFLASNGGASGVSGISYLNGFNSGSTLDNTLFEFTGSALFTNGQTYTVAHDDGTIMYVNGVAVLSQPGPTSPNVNTYTYTGPTGTFSFDFLYGETNGAPAVYETNLSGPLSATPEPGSIVLLGSGLLSAAGMIRRRRA